MIGPTVDEWLDELSQLSKKESDPGMTAAEFAKQSRMSVKRVRELLGLAGRSGRLTVGWRVIARMDGRACQVPVYRIKPAVKQIVSKKKKP